MEEFGRWEDSNWVWEINMRRPLFNWNVEQWNCFLLALDSIVIRRNVKDALAWTFCPNGLFSVSSFHRCLEGNSVGNISNISFIWQGIYPPKIEVFT